jgi:hypothetical protein
VKFVSRFRKKTEKKLAIYSRIQYTQGTKKRKKRLTRFWRSGYKQRFTPKIHPLH